MKRILSVAAILFFVCSVAGLSAPAPKKPKLIVAVVVDQFRYDYLLRFRADYTSGLKKILEQGAVFDDAHHIHYPTVTAVGHSTFLSGATPSMSGIVGNEWYERGLKKSVTSVSDDDTKLVGGVPGAIGSSPRRLLVSTLGDEIKIQGHPSKVIGISIKDRGAILPVGHMADAAYWFDADSSRWTTSSYFMESLPEWVKEANASRPNARTLGAVWAPVDAKPGDKPFCTMVAGEAGVRNCGALEATPWGNEIIEELAESAVTAEKMGHHEGTDLLAVSFSSNDYVGHAVGPDAPEVRDMSIRTDRLLGKLLDSIDKEAGLDNVMFVLTADHGVAPVPEVNQARNMPGGRIKAPAIGDAIQQALETKFGGGRWVIYNSAGVVYFDPALIRQYRANPADVQRAAAEAVRAMPHIFRVYTADELRNAHGTGDPVTAALTYGYYGARSGDIFIVAEPYYLDGDTGTTHGTPFGYDTHVPVIFMGPGIRPGHYYEKIAVNDIAPTLAAIAGVETPSGSIGRVLLEMWQ
jgi:predicted AlkP superfamily pyrophosphatase or phosphodiesterase